MKRVVALILLFAGSFAGFAQSARVLPGQPFAFEFTPNNLIGPGGGGLLNENVFFGTNYVTNAGDILDSGEQLRIEYFANSLLETPVRTSFLSGPAFSYGAGQFTNTWDDLQGFIQFSINQGSVDISRMTFDIVRADGRYSQNVILGVPEPGSAALLGVGLGAWLCSRLRRNTRKFYLFP